MFRQLFKRNLSQTILANSTPAPFHEIPTKGGRLRANLDLVLAGGPGYLHEHCHRRHNELGPIYREHLGANQLVFLADTRLIQTVISHEGQYPHHSVPETWLFYNSIKNIERGLFFRLGEPWLKLRKSFNKVFLSKSSDMDRFKLGILKINNELLDYWTSNFRLDDGTTFVKDLKRELCKWSLETTSFVLFGSQLPKDSRVMDLVHSVTVMFEQTSKFQVVPVKLAYKFGLPVWKKFESASDKMLAIANEYAREYIAKLRQSPNETCGLVGDLLRQGELSDDEITSSIVDLIIAAADTTSNSLQWLLYSLAKNPDVAQKIRFELENLPGNTVDGPASYDNFKSRIPYLRAFMRETHRLYPTAPFLARTLEKDIVLDGYLVPASQPIVLSLFTTSRMSKYFEQPEAFIPERWLRSANNSQASSRCPARAHASLPFGLGSRMCVGRRVADLEMSLFIATLLERFDCSVDDQDVGIKLKMVLCSKRPINLKLTPRR